MTTQTGESTTNRCKHPNPNQHTENTQKKDKKKTKNRQKIDKYYFFFFGKEREGG
jgi:hypothetical protein